MKKPLKCLIIEDDIAIVYIMKMELSNYGYEVIEKHVENASQMKVAIKNYDFDIIISDHVMPSFSSLEALKIRNKVCKEIPFLIYSNYIPENYKLKAIEEGCNMIIKKDDVMILLKAIEQLTKKYI